MMIKSTTTTTVAALTIAALAAAAQAQLFQPTISLEAGPGPSQVSVLVTPAFPISFAVVTLTSSAMPSVSGGPGPGHIDNATVVFFPPNVIPVLANGALSLSTPDFSPMAGIGPGESLLATIEFGSALDVGATICIIGAVVGIASSPVIAEPCAVVPGAEAEMETFTGTVRSDPHLKGLRGQEFDFTGEPGKIYALVSDLSLEINARFGAAWAHVINFGADKFAEDSLQTKGTWITALGLIVKGKRIAVSVEEDEETAAEEEMLCPNRRMAMTMAAVASAGSGAEAPALSSCFLIGVVQIEGVNIFHTGVVDLDEALTLTLRNSKSFGRVEVNSSSSSLDLAIDTVPPPPKWAVDPSTTLLYSHINLHIRRVALSAEADGVLGQTSRPSLDPATGAPILKTSDANGAGVLQNAPEDFEVSQLFAADAVVNRYRR